MSSLLQWESKGSKALDRKVKLVYRQRVLQRNRGTRCCVHSTHTHTCIYIYIYIHLLTCLPTYLPTYLWSEKERKKEREIFILKNKSKICTGAQQTGDPEKSSNMGPNAVSQQNSFSGRSVFVLLKPSNNWMTSYIMEGYLLYLKSIHINKCSSPPKGKLCCSTSLKVIRW